VRNGALRRRLRRRRFAALAERLVFWGTSSGVKWLHTSSRSLALFAIAALATASDAAQAPPASTRTLAGNGAAGNADGPAARATFMLPTVVRYGAGGTLYILDTAGQRVRALSARGVVSTVAGGGAPTADGLAVGGAFADGAALEARFNDPTGLAVGNDGALYVADTDNHCIRRIKNGRVTTFAGKAGTPGHDDGARAAATFLYPQGIAFDATGTLWVADNGVGLRRVRRDGLVETMRLVPNDDRQFYDVASWGRGRDQRLFLTGPAGITVYDPTVNVTQTVHDTNESGGALAPYALAPLSRDQVLAVDPGWNDVRYIRLARPPLVAYSMQRVIAGSPLAAADRTGGFRDAAPLDALFAAPSGLAIAQNGDVAIADAGNRRIRLVPSFERRRAITEPVVPALSRSDYNVVFVGNSFAFWNSLWDDSVAGAVERGLNAERARLGIPRRVRITAARFDGAGIGAQASYIREYVADARPDLVVWSFNSFDFGAEEQQNAAVGGADAASAYLTQSLAETRALLSGKSVALVAAAQPVGVGVAPTEATFGKLTISAYRPFESGLRSERRVESAIEASGVGSILTLGAFIAAEREPRNKPLYESVRGGIHFTAAGNAFYAEQLLRGLERLRPWSAHT